MQIDVEDNPNCAGSGQFVYSELGTPRPVAAILVDSAGEETRYDVTGVTADGLFERANAVKIADSGAGFAWLIYGGAWGIRMRPDANEWSLDDDSQWGEPFKIYGSEEDIVYA
ncbi:MAG TPA: hypothetical protein VL404_01310 [Candidatus Eisenbacteria bacterium]|jgi:hypothetical protein|nr:hypothetical protein [Candidatus Eisenbacteria bacterium]